MLKAVLSLPPSQPKEGTNSKGNGNDANGNPNTNTGLGAGRQT
jgi:hypothetical protein